MVDGLRLFKPKMLEPRLEAADHALGKIIAGSDIGEVVEIKRHRIIQRRGHAASDKGAVAAGRGRLDGEGARTEVVERAGDAGAAIEVFVLPHGGEVGLEEDVTGIGLEDDVASQAAAKAVRALGVDGQVGSGRARFREGVDVQMGVSSPEGRPDDPILIRMKIIPEIEIADILLTGGAAVCRFAQKADVPAVGVIIVTEGEEAVGVEAVIEVGGKKAGRIAVDVGLTAAGIGLRVRMVVIEEDARRQMGG